MRSFPVQSGPIQSVCQQSHLKLKENLTQNSDSERSRPFRTDPKEIIHLPLKDSYKNKLFSSSFNGLEEVNSNSSNPNAFQSTEVHSISRQFESFRVKTPVQIRKSPVKTTTSSSNRSFATFLENSIRFREIESRQVETSQLERWGYAPQRMFCCKCQRHVGTEVRFQYKKLSFWQKICCSNFQTRKKKDEIVVHKCRYCYKVLAELFINHPEN